MVSDAQKRASKKWKDKHYKQVKLEMPIEEAENLENICKLHNYTKMGFIREAIKEKIARLERLENNRHKKEIDII